MDSSKFSVPEVLLKESPPSTFMKQYYSLPSPIIKYILENASAINYFKLFQTCKILQNFIQEKYGPQIDVLEAGYFNRNSYFFSIQARNKEIKIRGSSKIYNELPKNQKIWIRKRLMFHCLPGYVSKRYFKRLNLSTVKEIYLFDTAVKFDDYKKLLVPSVEILYATVCCSTNGFDIISHTLKSLPNLKVLRLPWHQNLTTFVELTSIKRDKKLQKAEIYEFIDEFDENNLRGFIVEHMAHGATLYLSFREDVPQTVKDKYQDFAEDFNMFSGTKIMIR
uniref:F-box domain-containing protein n=1 Tax=Panagrolaimus davidi TaxID=227884 RepID=A0A914Q9H7_9BILA